MNTTRQTILQKGKGRTRKNATRKYLYERQSLYFAQVNETVKELAVKELKQLGGVDLKPVFRGIWFKASQKDFYTITYFSRMVSRVLVPLEQFQCPDQQSLYKAARQVKWEEFLSPKNKFSISANVSRSTITHSNFAGLRVKDAIADYFMDRSNKRPNVDAKSADIIFHLHIYKDQATLAMDASGGPLHKRGYREETVAGPMHETIAAAIITLSEWDGKQPLYDPMCGSGTLLCEALMKQCRIPAQVFRSKFGFEMLPDFDARLWNQVKHESKKNLKTLPKGLIGGSDISQYAVKAAKTNMMGLHSGSSVTIDEIDFSDIPSLNNHVIVTNPPYGIRMGKEIDLNRLYKHLGVFLKNNCRQSTAFVYFGTPQFIKKVPLAPAWKRPLEMGGLEGKLVKYELY